MPAEIPPVHGPSPDLGLTLALAVVAASDSPMLLLDGKLHIVAASDSFGDAFGLDAHAIAGMLVFDLADGAWDLQRLRSLLNSTLSGLAKIERYELDIELPGIGHRRLVFKAEILDYGITAEKRMLVAVADVTEARLTAKAKEDLLRNKTDLVKEVQHRVANSLQIIASILTQSARNSQSDEVRGQLSNAHQRVMSIASLQRQLAETGTGDVALAPYLSQLCESIGASMIEDHDQLTLTTHIDRKSVPADISVSLGLVVTELVINALKHAFPDGQRGHVMVDFASQGAEWTLMVADDGVGMPVKPEKARSGLGTSIVQALARQLHAEIDVADNAPGTKVSLVHGKQTLAQDAANDEADQVAV